MLQGRVEESLCFADSGRESRRHAADVPDGGAAQGLGAHLGGAGGHEQDSGGKRRFLARLSAHLDGERSQVEGTGNALK